MFKQFLAVVFSVAALGFASPTLAAEGGRVVYHINDAASQALGGLRNIRNHLDTAPDTKIVVVNHAKGVDYLMTDYKDHDTVAPLVAALAARGVEFDVCEITLKNRKLDKGDFILEADFVPSGVVRITQLQNDGYAYIKP